MGTHPHREISVERQEELFTAFVDAYCSTETRLEVDRFLRGIFTFSAREAPEESAA